MAGRGRRLTGRAAGPLAECLFSGYKSVMTAESGRGHAPSAESGEDQSDGAEPGEAPEPAGGPRRIVVAGDWHGDEEWAVSVIRRVPHLLAGESQRVILHLGDFGIWPDRQGKMYLDRVSGALAEAGAELWFVDGNHEDFAQLDKLDENPGPDGRVTVVPRVRHLPRGYRWNWHGLTWLACGGAVSLDRAVRTEGVDWWPEEEITAGQEAAISSGVGRRAHLRSPAGRVGPRGPGPQRRAPAPPAAHRGRGHACLPHAWSPASRLPADL
jgi:Calcineurin-like phosphoesterase